MESNIRNRPLVSVLFPVFNAEETLERALDSLINQTYENIEIIAINDGSTDNSLRILEEYKSLHPRVKVFSRENKGLITTLNEGLTYAKGEYIVREDSDDYSHPDRVAIQVAFMEDNKEITVAGTFSQSFGRSNKASTFPVSREMCKSTMLFYPCVSHPSTIIRKSFIDINKLNYPTSYKHCEDYAFWVCIIDAGGEIANIPTTLHYYNNHDGQVSVKNMLESSENHYRLVSKRLKNLGIEVESEVLSHLVYANKANLKKLTKSLFQKVLDKYQEIIFKTESQGYSKKVMQKTIHNMIKEPIVSKIGIEGFIIYEKNRNKFGTSFDTKLMFKALARTGKNILKKLK